MQRLPFLRGKISGGLPSRTVDRTTMKLFALSLLAIWLGTLSAVASKDDEIKLQVVQNSNSDGFARRPIHDVRSAASFGANRRANRARQAKLAQAAGHAGLAQAAASEAILKKHLRPTPGPLAQLPEEGQDDSSSFPDQLPENVHGETTEAGSPDSSGLSSHISQTPTHAAHAQQGPVGGVRQDHSNQMPPFHTPWYSNAVHGRFFVDVDDTLMWRKPAKGEVVLTHVPGESIARVGDVVEKSFTWKSFGENVCNPAVVDGYCRMAGACAAQSPSCLWGSGDFRIGLYDSAGTTPIMSDGFAPDVAEVRAEEQLSSLPFAAYRGYHFAVSPHVSTAAQPFEFPESHWNIPCGMYRRAPWINKGLFGILNVGMQGDSCFGAPLGHDVLISLRLNRVSPTAIQLSISMNGHTYTSVDDWAKYHPPPPGPGGAPADPKLAMPNVIDTVVIQYPEARGYKYVRMGFSREPGANGRDASMQGEGFGASGAAHTDQWGFPAGGSVSPTDPWGPSAVGGGMALGWPGAHGAGLGGWGQRPLPHVGMPADDMVATAGFHQMTALMAKLAVQEAELARVRQGMSLNHAEAMMPQLASTPRLPGPSQMEMATAAQLQQQVADLQAKLAALEAQHTAGGVAGAAGPGAGAGMLGASATMSGADAVTTWPGDLPDPYASNADGDGAGSQPSSGGQSPAHGAQPSDSETTTPTYPTSPQAAPAGSRQGPSAAVPSTPAAASLGPVGAGVGVAGQAGTGSVPGVGKKGKKQGAAGAGAEGAATPVATAQVPAPVAAPVPGPTPVLAAILGPSGTIGPAQAQPHAGGGIPTPPRRSSAPGAGLAGSGAAQALARAGGGDQKLPGGAVGVARRHWDAFKLAHPTAKKRNRPFGAEDAAGRDGRTVVNPQDYEMHVPVSSDYVSHDLPGPELDRVLAHVTVQPGEDPSHVRYEALLRMLEDDDAGRLHVGEVEVEDEGEAGSAAAADVVVDATLALPDQEELPGAVEVKAGKTGRGSKVGQAAAQAEAQAAAQAQAGNLTREGGFGGASSDVSKYGGQGGDGAGALDTAGDQSVQGGGIDYTTGYNDQDMSVEGGDTGGSGGQDVYEDFRPGASSPRMPATLDPPFNSHWYASHENIKLTHYAEQGVLEWSHPQPLQMILTHVTPERLLRAGDVVKKSFLWSSSGHDECPASAYAAGGYCRDADECRSHSVHCLFGTGDFRIGLFDTITNNVTKVWADGFAHASTFARMDEMLKEPPFSQFRGYHFRIFPHLSDKAEIISSIKGGGHIPCGAYRKFSTRLFDRVRVPTPTVGCFGAPLGKWSRLDLEITKANGLEYHLKMSMNGHTYEYVDNWRVRLENDRGSRAQHMHAIFGHTPFWVDTIVIQYPMDRAYSFLRLKQV
eukprot:jgi/Mesvir1/21593/Mv04026-RA.1